jgi:hypothetical protein
MALLVCVTDLLRNVRLGLEKLARKSTLDSSPATKIKVIKETMGVKTFLFVTDKEINKLEHLPVAACLIFAFFLWSGALQKSAPLNGRLLTLVTNIRLGLKCFAGKTL